MHPRIAPARCRLHPHRRVGPRKQAARAKLNVGAQLQAATLQDKITPRQALDLFGSFYPHRFSSEELLGRFNLDGKADEPFVRLSGGQRQRLFLALAMVNRPTVLVLDEPTAGLDPQARRQLRALIRELQTEGRTVLLSTHDLEEAGELCDRVAILDHGRIIASHRRLNSLPARKPPRESSCAHRRRWRTPVVNSLPDIVRAAATTAVGYSTPGAEPSAGGTGAAH
ncbi:MAG: ABC transporter ATP-binding protein [Ignavibacteriota bacterium]